MVLGGILVNPLTNHMLWYVNQTLYYFLKEPLIYLYTG